MATHQAPAEDPFAWLREGNRGPEYISFSEFSNHSACSFDFGEDGFAASCNYGGELLQMTARTNKQDIIFARGDFEYSLYLSLARAQRERGGKSSFGLKIASFEDFIDTKMKEKPHEKAKDRRFRLGRMVDRGSFNYRWPFNQYSLVVDRPAAGNDGEATSGIEDHLEKFQDERGERVAAEVGTCSMLSFVEDGTVYQVLLLDQRRCHSTTKNCTTSPPQTNLTLTIGGPRRSHCFHRDTSQHSACMGGGEDQNKFEEGKLLEPNTDVACFYGKAHGDKKVRWEARLCEYNHATGRFEEVKLKEYGDAEGHCSNPHSDTKLPLYQADLDERPPKKSPASRIFLASFRLSNGTRPVTPTQGDKISEASQADQSLSGHKILSPDDIARIVGVDPGNSNATGPMWKSVFCDRQERMERLSELPEADIVARCLAKILHVDLIPIKSPPANESDLKWSAPALVHNLFFQAAMDLKSIFWKIRFLVKVDGLLTATMENSHEMQDDSGKPVPAIDAKRESRDKMGDAGSGDQHLSDLKILTIQRVRDAIGSIVEDLVRSIPILDDDPDYYYIMVTIWYVVNHYSQHMDKWDWKKNLKPGGKKWWKRALDHTPRSFYPSVYSSPERECLLKWFHHQALLSLTGEDPHSSDGTTVKQLRLDARIALSKRICSGQPYRPADEIVDRLAFLAEELWPELENAKIVAARASRRIESRNYTQALNPGPASPSLRDKSYASGPWEIHALCHHSRQVVAYRKICSAKNAPIAKRAALREDAERFASKIAPFLTSWAALTPCWERTAPAARRGFLRSEATAVFASTILDIFRYDLEHTEITTNQPNSRVNLSQASLYAFNTAPGWFLGSQGFPSSPATMDDLPVLRLEIPKNLPSDREPGTTFDYLRFRPPQKHHPDEFFNSLDDTPHLYRESFIKAQVKFLPTTIGKIIPEAQDLCKKGIVDLKEHSETLESLAVVDVKVPSSPQPMPELIWGHEGISRLKDSLVDQEVRHRLLVSRDLPIRLLGLLTYVLHREMIDGFEAHALGLSKFVLKKKKASTMLYITLRSWSLDCSSRETGTPSSPHGTEKGDLNEKELVQLDDILSIELPEQLRKPFEVSKINGGKWHFNAAPKLKLEVSSIGMSTNGFGDFSKCTVIADLAEDERTVHEQGEDSQTGGAKKHPRKEARGREEQEKKEQEKEEQEKEEQKKKEAQWREAQERTLETLGQEAQKIWDTFIHQPQTARFLVFSLLLRQLCEKMARNYRHAVKEFTDKFQFDDPSKSGYLQNSEELRKTKADGDLKLSLWSLEVLHKLSNTMAVSIRELEQAKEELRREIEQEAEARSEQLEEKCQEQFAKLEQSLRELTAVQTKLEMKTERNNRYASALSAVLALADSRASNKQSNTMQKLTYITIGFLPLGLVSAVFAVPNDQNVLSPKMGLRWFVGILFIFLVFIFVLAYCMDGIVGWLESVENSVKRKCRDGLECLTDWLGKPSTEPTSQPHEPDEPVVPRSNVGVSDGSGKLDRSMDKSGGGKVNESEVKPEDMV